MRIMQLCFFLSSLMPSPRLPMMTPHWDLWTIRRTSDWFSLRFGTILRVCSAHLVATSSMEGEVAKEWFGDLEESQVRMLDLESFWLQVSRSFFCLGYFLLLG